MSSRAFRSGKPPSLLQWVSARGLDIKNMMHVINYNLPNSDHGGIHEYAHRIGRTARIGNIGLATSFYNNKNGDIAEALAKLLMKTYQNMLDFLRSYKPEDEEELRFDVDLVDEDNGATGDDV